MEIGNTNTLVPVLGLDQLPAGLEKQKRDMDVSKGYPRQSDRIVFIGYRPRYYENVYSPHGKSRAQKIETGGIVDIYI